MWVLILLKDEIFFFFSKNNMYISHVYLISSPFRFYDCVSDGGTSDQRIKKKPLPWITDESLQRRRMRNRQLFHKSLFWMQVPGMDDDGVGVFGCACPATKNPAETGLASISHVRPRTSHRTKYIHRLLLVPNIPSKQIGWPHCHVLFNIDFGGIWYPSTAVGSVRCNFWAVCLACANWQNFRSLLSGQGILKKTSIWLGMELARNEIDSGHRMTGLFRS